MLNPAKASPKALLSSAKDLLDKKQYRPAELYLLEILRRNINDDEALATLAELYAAQGGIREAFAYYMFAIRANPASLRYKERFIELSADHLISNYDELTEQTVVACLKMHETLDCMPLRMFWATHLMANPAFHAAFGLKDKKPLDPANKVFFEGLSDFKPLFTPCFLLGMKALSAYSRVFEEFIAHMRQHLLDDLTADKKKFMPEESVTLAAALAHQCFYTDYILDCTAEEQKKIDALRIHLETDKKTAADAASVALFACYAPLYTLKNAAEILQTFSEVPEIGDVVEMQIADYNALRETAASITAITPIEDGVSAQVQEQYEEFPYPRWNLLPKRTVVDDWINEHKKISAVIFGRKIKILSAGCGTGKEPISLAGMFPHAEILAVDLSRTSLAYGINKAKELNIRNITFRQADILRLGMLDEKFDYIVSGGVLHHLQDPVKGWKVLCGLLKPEGLMTIGLYSTIARRAIIKVRKVIQQAHCANDFDSMRLFRKNGLQLLERPVLENIARFADYYHMSMYRDLLFNVQEHTYELPELGRLLKELHLEFLGFANQPAILAAYGKEYPDDPEKTNLDNWRLFEQKNPDTFAQMYLFWCRKEQQHA